MKHLKVLLLFFFPVSFLSHFVFFFNQSQCRFVAAHKYGQAIDLYSQAIELNGDNAVYWANRAFAHSKLEEYGSAIQDASKATEIDPKYSKAKHICLEFFFFLF